MQQSGMTKSDVFGSKVPSIIHIHSLNHNKLSHTHINERSYIRVIISIQSFTFTKSLLNPNRILLCIHFFLFSSHSHLLPYPKFEIKEQHVDVVLFCCCILLNNSIHTVI